MLRALAFLALAASATAIRCNFDFNVDAVAEAGYFDEPDYLTRYGNFVADWALGNWGETIGTGFPIFAPNDPMGVVQNLVPTQSPQTYVPTRQPIVGDAGDRVMDTFDGAGAESFFMEDVDSRRSSFILAWDTFDTTSTPFANSIFTGGASPDPALALLGLADRGVFVESITLRNLASYGEYDNIPSAFYMAYSQFAPGTEVGQFGEPVVNNTLVYPHSPATGETKTYFVGIDHAVSIIINTLEPVQLVGFKYTIDFGDALVTCPAGAADREVEACSADVPCQSGDTSLIPQCIEGKCVMTSFMDCEQDRVCANSPEYRAALNMPKCYTRITADGLVPDSTPEAIIENTPLLDNNVDTFYRIREFVPPPPGVYPEPNFFGVVNTFLQSGDLQSPGPGTNNNLTENGIGFVFGGLDFFDPEDPMVVQTDGVWDLSFTFAYPSTVLTNTLFNADDPVTPTFLVACGDATVDPTELYSAPCIFGTGEDATAFSFRGQLFTTPNLGPNSVSTGVINRNSVRRVTYFMNPDGAIDDIVILNNDPVCALGDFVTEDQYRRLMEDPTFVPESDPFTTGNLVTLGVLIGVGAGSTLGLLM